MAHPSRTTTAPTLLIVDERGGAPFQILPEHINTGAHFFEAFGNTETEYSASWIVQFCKERGGWVSFSYEEIEEFYHRKSKGRFSNFTFNKLLDWNFINDPKVTTDRGFIVCGKDGRFRVTVDFIARCYRSAPQTQPVPA